MQPNLIVMGSPAEASPELMDDASALAAQPAPAAGEASLTVNGHRVLVSASLSGLGGDAHHQRQMLSALEALETKVKRLDAARREAIDEREQLQRQFDALSASVDEQRRSAADRDRRYDRDAAVVDATIRFERAEHDRRLKEALARKADLGAVRHELALELADARNAAAVLDEQAAAAEDLLATAEADIARADASAARRQELRLQIAAEPRDREPPLESRGSPDRIGRRLLAETRALHRAARAPSPAALQRGRARDAARKLRDEKAAVTRRNHRSYVPPASAAPPRRAPEPRRREPRRAAATTTKKKKKTKQPAPPPPPADIYDAYAACSPRRSPPPRREPAPSALTDADYAPPPPPPADDGEFRRALAEALSLARDPAIASALAQVYAHASVPCNLPERDAELLHDGALETALDALDDGAGY